MTQSIISLSYIIASVLFILSIRGLASPETARRGNVLGIVAMLIAIATAIYSPITDEYIYVIIATIIGGGIGVYGATKVKLTALPQMIALLNGCGGLVAVLVSYIEITGDTPSYTSSCLGLIIGAIACTGSLVAFAKLQGIIPTKPIVFPCSRALNAAIICAIAILAVIVYKSNDLYYFYALIVLALLFGFLAVMPIGGADMPVVISFLNSYTGWAAVFVGFAFESVVLIIVGAIVGASGAILSYIMSKAMNRSLTNIILGGFGGESSANGDDDSDKYAKAGSPEDAAFIMKNASKVIIVPGYGMAVAQAQHIVQEMSDILQREGVEVKFAIHPVAGRMPGHMNVLLAEANVPYEIVYELEDINRDFANADVAYVIGANDITNPLAKTDSSSPIFGMPILEVEKAKTVFFVKRSLASGYAGVDNPLFYKDNTIMLYGDAKKITEQVVAGME